MEKSESERKRSDSCNNGKEDGATKTEQKPKDDFSGHGTTDAGSKLTSASEPKKDPKEEKVQGHKKTASAKQEDQIKEVRREQEATEIKKEEQKVKEKHEGRKKLKRLQKQEKIEIDEEKKDIQREKVKKTKEEKEEEGKKEIEKAVKHHHKDEVKAKGTYEEKEPKQKTVEREKVQEKVRKEEKEEKKEGERKNEKEEKKEDRKDEKEEEKEQDRKEDKKQEQEEDKEEEREEQKEEEKNKEKGGEKKELRDDANPTVKSRFPDDRNDIIEKHPILVGLLNSESSPLKNPGCSASISACGSSSKSGIPKRIPLATARRSVSPQPRVRRPDSPSFPEERNVCPLSPKIIVSEDPLPGANIPDLEPLPDTAAPGRFAPSRNVVVEGALARARQARNVRPGSRDPDNKAGSDFNRPPPSDRPAPRKASKSPSSKIPTEDQPPSPKRPNKEQRPSPKKRT